MVPGQKLSSAGFSHCRSPTHPQDSSCRSRKNIYLPRNIIQFGKLISKSTLIVWLYFVGTRWSLNRVIVFFHSIKLLICNLLNVVDYNAFQVAFSSSINNHSKLLKLNLLTRKERVLIIIYSCKICTASIEVHRVEGRKNYDF